MSLIAAVGNADSGALVCVIVAVGMSVAFIYADRSSLTTRLLAAFLVLIGLSIFANIAFVRAYAPAQMPWASHLAPVFTGLSLIVGAEWILRIRRMVPAGNLLTWFGDAQFRVAQLLALVYIVLGVRYNVLRAEYFIGAVERENVLGSVFFWMFAAPFGLAILAIMEGTLITLRRKPDRAEGVRLLGIALASPLIAAGLLLPAPLASYSSALGQMVFLVAAVQYHVLQGQRGQFLKRFLAPSVAALVRKDGLDAALERRKLPVAVLACDLRGYTAFAHAHDSHHVIEVLRRFYDVVGDAAARYGATIKDYAGDGVLLLLGAPLPVDDAAAQAVALADTLRADCAVLFRQMDIDLGLGVGIASGEVSVGAIGQGRLEYVAVGRAINLAARLCQAAASEEVLLDGQTRDELSDRSRILPGDRLSLKGFEDEVESWRLSSSRSDSYAPA